ncbi:PTI1-like tyrosine-protein kinase 3 [Zea mays]|uniref:PTI1-like tyrosine-protein kinase 3 n=1 Tax=Zea mays TaxID=4577 RepID=A0A1D6HY74_MAIZE|nr:PTI1-like tyrosine-protein kinase 3 [Zea mays]
MRERSSNPIPFEVHGLLACLMCGGPVLVAACKLLTFSWDWWKHQRSPLVIAEELDLIRLFFLLGISLRFQDVLVSTPLLKRLAESDPHCCNHLFTHLNSECYLKCITPNPLEREIKWYLLSYSQTYSYQPTNM